MNFYNPSGPKDYSAGYFGKLPEYPDFVKFNAATPEILTLDKWIQEGITSARKNFNRTGQVNQNKNIFQMSSSPINFLFPFTGTENIIIGIIYPSHDKSGREFPFIFFLNFKKSDINGIPPHLLYPFSSQSYSFFTDLFNENNSARDSLTRFSSKINQSTFRNLLFNIPEEDILKSYTDFLENMNRTEFVNKVFGPGGDSILLNILNNLHRGLSFLAARPELSVSFGIKISFSRIREYNDFDTAFFLHLVLSISGRSSRVPAFFLKEHNSLAHLYIFFCSPLPYHLMDLFSDNHKDERILNANKNQEEENTGYFENHVSDIKLSGLIKKLHQ